MLIFSVLGTHYGDVNMDRRFSSEDLISVLAAREYEDGIPENSGWAEGDWDGDGDFTTSDLIHVLQFGGYTVAAQSTSGTTSVIEWSHSPSGDQAAAVDAIWNQETAPSKHVEVDLAFSTSSCRWTHIRPR